MPKLTDWLKERAAQQSDAPPPKPAKSGLRHAWYKVKGLPAPCAKCRGMSEFLCDYLVLEGVTCSAPLCRDCAKEIGPDRHLCPLHVKVLERRKGSLL